MVGTSGYFAPEMIYNKNNYNSKCDIWSLGCVLYYLVCNYFPFHLTYNKSCYIEQLKNNTSIHFNHQKWNNIILHDLCKNMLVYDYNKRFSANDCLKLINTF